MALLGWLLMAPALHGGALELRGGLWFDGSRLVKRTMYAVDGVLRTRRPPGALRRIDLTGRFVVPPLAEAHNHWVEPLSVDAYVRAHLADGVFYVMDQATMPLLAEPVRAKTNRPESVDYAAALLGITGPGGHPIQIVEQLVKVGLITAAWAPDGVDGNAVLVVESERDLEERWELLARARTDFVKVFLLYSEEYEQRRNDPRALYQRGLDPRLLPSVVARAHRDGLRVSAHVYSTADFRAAAAAGVDLIAHLPGAGASTLREVARYRLDDASARLAGREGVAVITTLGWLDELRRDDPAYAETVTREIVLPNLALLKRHGVPLLLGSDQFRETSLPELMLLASLRAFDSRELLRMATMDTPRAIFPGRRVGCLESGCEASLLVLDGDPLADLGNLRRISLRIKQGVVLPPPAPQAATP
jgi:imidazolonepropionase-like amidohydrolase